MKMCMPKYYSDTTTCFRTTNKKLTKKRQAQCEWAAYHARVQRALFDAIMMCDWDGGEGGRGRDAKLTWVPLVIVINFSYASKTLL